MRILFLTPQSPYPPHKGTSTRNYNLIRHVAARHEVHLLSFTETDNALTPTLSQRERGPGQAGPAADAHLAELRQCCATVEMAPAPRRSKVARLATALLSSTPDLALRLASAEFTERLVRLLERTPFDLVQVEGLEMAPHWLALETLPQVPNLREGGPPKAIPQVRNLRDGEGPTPPVFVLDEHNCEYLLQRRAFETDLAQPRKWPGALYSFLQWPRLRGYEARACRLADGVVAVSENDRATLAALAPDRPMVVVPNGVDPDYFRPEDIAREPATLVFTGTMDFRPNVDAVLWFCREVFPRIRSQVPAAQFCIVGQRPKPEVQRLAEKPGVVVTGAVEDVRPYLWRAALCVVPLRVGGGTRFKILEALACGTPVVSTTLGAEGIALTPDEHAALADGPEALAAAVVGLLREPERARAMAGRGQAFAVANYAWGVLAGGLLSFYEAIGLKRTEGPPV